MLTVGYEQQTIISVLFRGSVSRTEKVWDFQAKINEMHKTLSVCEEE